MSKYTYYKHHDTWVWVDDSLLGIHKMHCLCYKCDLFKPNNRADNCKIANAVYALNQLASITTPVWECPDFIEKESEEE